MKAEFVSLKDMSFDVYEDIFTLAAMVWPPKEPVPAREKFDSLKSRIGRRPEGFSVVYEGSELLGTAYIEERIITVGDKELPVAALGGVCTHPDVRGRGLGALAVRKVFEAVDAGEYPVCLFQTSFKVEPFYLKLGAARITNRIVNSLARTGLPPRQMRRQVFWDDVVMIYPGTFCLPSGDINLQGPGY
ncbi:MAG: GNAT family N-acetyltransferase [Spirochaetales bacterium]|nr:GNAT family N-acetyltransferase [Spirochaetales bacterium]